MVSVRAAKAKGSSHEYDCQESLQTIYPDIYRTSERGFCLQYDLITDEHKQVFECKRLAGISWNQCKKFLDKLEKVKPEGYQAALLFKSNHQPCLIMVYDWADVPIIKTFEDHYDIPFIKHTSTKVRRKKEDEHKDMASN